MGELLNVDNIIENSKNLMIGLPHDISNIQNNFLSTEFGQAVDNAINIGIKSLCPDFIENQIIEVKDAVLKEGVKAGINEAIEESLNLGKSLIGIFTGNFENIDQIQSAIKRGGLVDTISSVVDSGIDVAVETGTISKDIGKILKSGKNTLFKMISNNIDDSIHNQVSRIDKLDKYCASWREAYNNRDINKMNKIYKNIKKQLDSIVPLTDIIDKAKEIENIQNLVNNNGGNFDLSSQQLELAKVL